MKTLLRTLFAAGLLGAVLTLAGWHDAVGLFAFCVVTALVGWTLVQYACPPRLIRRERPVRLPKPGGGNSPPAAEEPRDRLAA